MVLVGDVTAIERAMSGQKIPLRRITIARASEVIGMTDPPSSFRTRKDASMVVCANMVRNKQADAMISAGNSAAVMETATFKLGRITGVTRPAIAAFLPGGSLLLDSGANTDCDYVQLVKFALIGSACVEAVRGIHAPSVTLLSCGEEECKGNEAILQARRALQNLHDQGRIILLKNNIEGRDLFKGIADVIVCDGLPGNVGIKSAEGLGELIMNDIEQYTKVHPLAWVPMFLLRGMFRGIKKKLDYTEFGGAPLLGVNGVCVIAHGRSDAKAIASAIEVAARTVNQNITEAITAAMSVPCCSFEDKEPVTAN